MRSNSLLDLHTVNGAHVRGLSPTIRFRKVDGGSVVFPTQKSLDFQARRLRSGHGVGESHQNLQSGLIVSERDRSTMEVSDGHHQTEA